LPLWFSCIWVLAGSSRIASSVFNSAAISLYSGSNGMFLLLLASLLCSWFLHFCIFSPFLLSINLSIKPLAVAAAAAASRLLVSIPGTTHAWALLLCSVNLFIWCGFLCDHLPILVRRFSLDFFVWLHSEAVWIQQFFSTTEVNCWYIYSGYWEFAVCLVKCSFPWQWKLIVDVVEYSETDSTSLRLRCPWHIIRQ
jgi:hypothetical protein